MLALQLQPRLPRSMHSERALQQPQETRSRRCVFARESSRRRGRRVAPISNCEQRKQQSKAQQRVEGSAVAVQALERVCASVEAAREQPRSRQEASSPAALAAPAVAASSSPLVAAAALPSVARRWLEEWPTPLPPLLCWAASRSARRESSSGRCARGARVRLRRPGLGRERAERERTGQ